ncbi:MAG TPA: zf-HC2 domain-containing protein [Gemmatimonadaceae bacterium]|jgi:anti-sigma factor RsiW
MNDDRHLIEDERQELVDDTLPAEQRAALEKHLATCAECADDVARLRDVTMQCKASPSESGPIGELWPSIRARIEEDKLVALGATASSVLPALPATRTGWLRARHIAVVGTLAAAAMLTVVVLRPSHRIAVDATDAVNDTSALRLASDSVKSYEDEAKTLLNRLELQRAMMRPEAAASIDRDLKVIDQAIAELQLAIQNDPRNAALRSLLASSYRQKVELLKRAGNAS